VVEIFPVLCQPATSTKPTDGALDYPAFWQNDEALRAIGTTDNFAVTMAGMMAARPS
jgi:hypothetical protein